MTSRPPGDHSPLRSSTDTLAPDDRGSEAQHLAALHEHLERSRENAAEHLRAVLATSPGSSPHARSERDSFSALYAAEIQRLDAARVGLCFGRIDLVDEASEPPTTDAGKGATPTVAGETRYIGRIGLVDEDAGYSSLLLDWRTPHARPFYLATTAHPEGVSRRRHFRTIGPRLTGLSDEYLDDCLVPGHAAELTEDNNAAGETALLAALSAARTGHMMDIVATIQREQDTIIRSPHRGVSVVEGGPGTGKTAVALHRIAYLLYTYREQLDRSGVLLLGPTRSFLDYIGQVLPTLGETGVVLRTIGTLYPGVEATAEDAHAAAEIKGSTVMLDVLREAVRDYQTLPQESVIVRHDGRDISIAPHLVRRARGRARSSRRPHNAAREVFARHLLDGVAEAYADDLGHNPDGSGSLLTASDREDIRAELENEGVLAEVLDAWWPLLDPPQVVARLFSERDRLTRAAGSILAEEDLDALLRENPAAITSADVPLIDEIAELVGPRPGVADEEAERLWQHQLSQAQDALDILSGSANQEYEDEEDSAYLQATDVMDAEELARRHRIEAEMTTAERAAADREWAYGHVVIDEAQELSAMAWRMVMRRSPNRWMTLVGDTAQTSSPAGTESWSEVVEPFVGNRWHHHELTVNYRTPADIMRLADDVLTEIMGRPRSRPVRTIRENVDGVSGCDAEGSWESAIGSAVTSALRHHAEAADAGMDAQGRERLLGIIASQARGGDVESVLESLVADGWTEVAGPHARVHQHTVSSAKGLEFDTVLIVDPVGIVDESPQGLNDLFVAVTRATRGLTVVYDGEVPYSLRRILG